MTKFEEPMDIITRNKNKGKNTDLDNVDSLEVVGSESSKIPLLACGDDDIDGSLVDDLYRKANHKPRIDMETGNGPVSPNG